MTLKRCSWVDLNNSLYVDYHDNEWGVPVHNDDKLFEMLILEGAQAGLSWATVIRNRLKIFSVRQNAKVFLQIQSEYGSFDEYIWKRLEPKLS